MEFTAEALILKIGRFREADLWVRFVTPTKGLLTAFAFGGLKSRRRFMGCLDALNRVRFRVRTGRGGAYLNLEEGHLVGSYANLRHNPELLGVAVNCIKFFEAVHLGLTHSRTAYDLLLQSLAAIDAGATSWLFPPLFRARLCFEQGLAPDLTACSHCGQDATCFDSTLFSPAGGNFLCPTCAAQHHNSSDLRLSRQALDLLTHIRTSPPEQWELNPTPPTARQECGRAVDAFVCRHLGLLWENGRFVKC